MSVSHPKKEAIEDLKEGENVTGHCGLMWVFSFFFLIIRLYLYHSYVNELITMFAITALKEKNKSLDHVKYAVIDINQFRRQTCNQLLRIFNRG